MGKLKYKLMEFMRGRYGQDALSKLILGTALVCFLASLFVLGAPLYYVSMLLIVLCYFRMFSKNIQKRYEENQKFLNMRYRLVCLMDRHKRRWRERKTHRFFKCSQCKQNIRVPKHKGNICVTCPKCRHEFLAKT